MAWLSFNPPPGVAFPSARECHSLCAWNDKLVLFGGNDNALRFNDVWIMDCGEGHNVIVGKGAMVSSLGVYWGPGSSIQRWMPLP